MVEPKQANQSRHAAAIDHTLLSRWDWKHVAQDLRLSPRELEVVQGLFDGLDAATIAQRLGVSIHTVRTHLGRMYRKLQVNTHEAVMLRIFAAHLQRKNVCEEKNLMSSRRLTTKIQTASQLLVTT